MIGLIKKVHSDDLLQLALLLSLLRVDRNIYTNVEVPATTSPARVGIFNEWENAPSSFFRHFQHGEIHPKNLDSMLLNYEQQVFDDLNSLGRYNNLIYSSRASRNVTAYLLNVAGNVGPGARIDAPSPPSSVSSPSPSPSPPPAPSASSVYQPPSPPPSTSPDDSQTSSPLPPTPPDVTPESPELPESPPEPETESSLLLTAAGSFDSLFQDGLLSPPNPDLELEVRKLHELSAIDITCAPSHYGLRYRKKVAKN